MADNSIEKFDGRWPNAGEGSIQAVMSDVPHDAIALQMEKREFDSPHGTASRADDFPVTEKAKRQLWRELYLRRSYVAALYKVKNGEQQ